LILSLQGMARKGAKSAKGESKKDKRIDFLGDFASWREVVLTLSLKGMARKGAKYAKGKSKKYKKNRFSLRLCVFA